MLIETILIECLKAIGKMFTNPLIYWITLLIIGTGYHRILQQRAHFGFKIFNVFSELKSTWIVSLVFGILISAITLGAGMVFTYELILILSIVIIFLSIRFNLTMLSASYSIGITFIIALLAFVFWGSGTNAPDKLFAHVNFTSLVILLGVLILAEALLMSQAKRNDTFPKLTKSVRGGWVGKQHIKKMSIIPFFVLVPSGLIEPIANYWPFFANSGEDSGYGILLVPFIIGFDHTTNRRSSEYTTTFFAKSLALLGFIVVLIGIGSIYVTWLSVVAVVLAILGRELISYRHRTIERSHSPFYNEMDSDLKVLSIIPGSPADRLGILVGETISKVNNQHVKNANEFYEALQNSGAFFKMTLLDDANEMRFVQSALYDGDHHELGIVFTSKPYNNQ